MRGLLFLLWVSAAHAGDVNPLLCAAASAVAAGHSTADLLPRLRELQALRGKMIELRTQDGDLVVGKNVGTARSADQDFYLQVQVGPLMKRVKVANILSVEGSTSHKNIVTHDLLEPLETQRAAQDDLDSRPLRTPSFVHNSPPPFRVPQVLPLEFIEPSQRARASIYGRAKNYVAKKTISYDAMDQHMTLFMGDLHLLRGNADLFETTLNNLAKNREQFKQVVITGDIIDASSLHKLSSELGLTTSEQKAQLLRKLQGDFFERVTKALLGLDHTQPVTLRELFEQGVVTRQQLADVHGRIQIIAGNHDLWRDSNYVDVWPKGKMNSLGVFELESLPPETQKLLTHLKNKRRSSYEDTLLRQIERNSATNKPIFLSSDLQAKLKSGLDVGEIGPRQLRLNTVYDTQISEAIVADMRKYGQVIAANPTTSTHVPLMVGPDGQTYYALVAHEPLFKGKNIDKGLPQFNHGLTPEGRTAMANAYDVLMVGADKHAPNAFKVPRGNVMRNPQAAPDFYYAMNGTLEGAMDSSRFQRGGMLVFKPRPPKLGSKKPEFDLYQTFFDNDGNMHEVYVDPAATPKAYSSPQEQ